MWWQGEFLCHITIVFFILVYMCVCVCVCVSIRYADMPDIQSELVSMDDYSALNYCFILCVIDMMAVHC